MPNRLTYLTYHPYNANHSCHTYHTYHTNQTYHTFQTSKHAIPDRPYTPYIPNTIPHPHHTTGKEGADLIWRQYMDGTHPIGGVAGHGAYIYIHACIYICGTIIYMYIQLYIFSLSELIFTASPVGLYLGSSWQFVILSAKKWALRQATGS